MCGRRLSLCELRRQGGARNTCEKSAPVSDILAQVSPKQGNISRRGHLYLWNKVGYFVDVAYRKGEILKYSILTDNRTTWSKGADTRSFSWDCEVCQTPLRFNILTKESHLCKAGGQHNRVNILAIWISDYGVIAQDSRFINLRQINEVDYWTRLIVGLTRLKN